MNTRSATSPRGSRRRAGAVAALAAALLAVPAASGAAPATAAPYCGITWGSGAKTSAPLTTGRVSAVRAGRHACFDRLVLDVAGGDVGYSVRYVDPVVRDGSGEPVPLRGGARLEVVATAPASATDAWFLPNGELLDASRYRTFRHLAWAGSFEGQSTFGLGVRARLPFRVLVVDGPGTGSRLVVDVAHRW